MPIRHIGTDISPLVYDDDYRVIDIDKLAEYIGEIMLGYYQHIKDIIDNLGTVKGPTIKSTKDAALDILNTKETDKLKGLLFQHMSWIALAMQYNTTNLKMVRPHDALAQHGLDGLAILLNEDGTINKIIITEDKCTDNPRHTITAKVYPEFDNIEKGKVNNQIVSGISSLVGYDRNLLAKIEPNICNQDFWQYRIGITRNDNYQDATDRQRLFKGYDSHVKGDVRKRHAATINIQDTAAWAFDLRDRIINYLTTKS